MFSEEVALAAARWVNTINAADSPGRWKPELEAWLAADPSHCKAFRAMKIAAWFRKASRPGATAQDMRELEIAIVGYPLPPPADGESSVSASDTD